MKDFGSLRNWGPPSCPDSARQDLRRLDCLETVGRVGNHALPGRSSFSSQEGSQWPTPAWLGWSTPAGIRNGDAPFLKKRASLDEVVGPKMPGTRSVESCKAARAAVRRPRWPGRGGARRGIMRMKAGKRPGVPVNGSARRSSGRAPVRRAGVRRSRGLFSSFPPAFLSTDGRRR